VCSHYFGFLYLLTCLLLTAVVAIVNPAVRARAWHRARSHRRLFAWWGALLALVGGLTLVHPAYRAPRLNHLAIYMFEPEGREPLTRFLARNLVAEFNLFSPLALATDAPPFAAAGPGRGSRAGGGVVAPELAAGGPRRCFAAGRRFPDDSHEGAGFGADEPKERIERAARAAGLRLGREVQFGSNRLLEVCLPEPVAPASAGRGGGPAAIP
jgi:hypothetical protein